MRDLESVFNQTEEEKRKEEEYKRRKWKWIKQNFPEVAEFARELAKHFGPLGGIKVKRL